MQECKLCFENCPSGGLGVLLAAQGKAMDEKISDVKDRQNMQDGRGSGLNAAWGYLIGVIGVLGAILAVALRR